MSKLTPLPQISKLSSYVIRILGCNPGLMTLQGTNTYLVGTGQRRILIDSGDEHTSPQYIKLLENVLKTENATIEHLIITHWHHDHIGGANVVKNLIETSTNESPIVWKLPLPENQQENKHTERLNGGEAVSSQLTSEVDCKKLVDNQIFDVSDAKLTVKHTPGHTADHVCLLLQEKNTDSNFIFSGDCILGETSAVFEDLSDYMQSLDKILNWRPKLIYPGHGPVVEDPEERINQYINHRNRREREIIAALEKNRPNALSAMDIVKKIYKTTPESLWPAAAYNVSHHLQKLMKENKVQIVDDNKWEII